MLSHHLRTRVALAWFSVLVGGAVATAALVYDGWPTRLPRDAVAMVGTQAIPREQWLRALAAVERDRGRPLAATERRAVLQRLIDEELLFQHAVDSGLARDDPSLRKTLVAGVIDAATADRGEDEAGARALFAQDPGYFAAQPRLRVTAVAQAPDATAPGADAVASALRDGNVTAPLHAIDLPRQPVPLPQLAHRLGGRAAEALRTAELGQLIGPLAGDGRSLLYLMVHERLADQPRYEAVADAVRVEWGRRQAEAELADLLSALRQSTSVRIADAPELE